MSELHKRLTRIALQELTGQAYTTVEDQAMAMAAVFINELELQEESRAYEEQEVTSTMGGEGNMRYGGQTVRSLGWRLDTRIVSPWVRADAEAGA